MSFEDFRKWLVIERQNRNWSQRELSRRSGVHHSSIALIETGDQGVTLPICEGLAKAFQVDVTHLLRYAGLIGNSIASDPPTDYIADRVNEIVKELNEADKAYLLQFAEFMKNKKGKPDVRPTARASPDILGRVRPKQKEKTPVT